MSGANVELVVILEKKGPFGGVQCRGICLGLDDVVVIFCGRSHGDERTPIGLGEGEGFRRGDAGEFGLCGLERMDGYVFGYLPFVGSSEIGNGAERVDVARREMV